jgi:hypothetical protein
MLHCTLLRSSPTSFRKLMAIAWSLKTYVKNQFGAPSSRSIRCPYKNRGTSCNRCRSSSYYLKISAICSTMTNKATYTLRLYKDAEATIGGGYGRRQALRVFHTKCEGTVARNRKENLKRRNTAAPLVSVSSILGTKFSAVATINLSKLLHWSNIDTIRKFLPPQPPQCRVHRFSFF